MNHNKMELRNEPIRPLWSAIEALSQPHFEASVRMKLTLPKVGTWSPPGLSKTQSLIAGVKTPRIEMFFTPLEGLEV
jgi:hypothetical protein